MKLRCNITTKQIIELANELGENPAITTNKVSVWQSRNNTSEMPVAADLKNLSIELEEEEAGMIPSDAQIYTTGKGTALFLTPRREVYTPEGVLVESLGENDEALRTILFAKAAIQMGTAIEKEIDGQKYAIRGNKSINLATGEVTIANPYYEGNITPEENTIFVFGSNPEGIHGAGAAKVAREKFGAVYGVGEGITGQSYALPTKDLRVKENGGLRSISKENIIESIKKMYETAKSMPDKQFKVAFRNALDEVTLNGYSGSEMIDMFNAAGPIPSNVLFSKEWHDTGRLDYSGKNLQGKQEVVHSINADSVESLQGIKEGKVTQLTKFTGEGKNLPYLKEIKAGELIEIKRKEGSTVAIVRVTKPLTRIQNDIDVKDWAQKANKTEEYFEKVVRNRISEGAWTIEFEYVEEREKTSKYNSAMSMSAEEAKEMGALPITTQDQQVWKPEQIDQSFDKVVSIAQSAIESDVAKLYREFRALELEDRIANVATLFSNAVDTIYENTLEELRDKAQNDPSIEERNKAQDLLSRYEDPINGRTKFLTSCNLKEVIDTLRADIEDLVLCSDLDYKSDRLSEEQKEKALYRRNEYQKVLDNLDLLLRQALYNIEANEGVRVVLKKFDYADGKGNVKQVLGGIVVEEEQEDEDDEEGQNKSDAVPFKVREQDQHRSLTTAVKSILRKIPKIEKMVNGNPVFEYDDLGCQRYLNENHAYACILNACKDMIDSQDFHIKEEVDGRTIHRLPALESMTSRYPWIQYVIRELQANPDLIPQFYTCFRMDFVPAWSSFVSEENALTFAPINRALGMENAYEDILRSYEQSDIIGNASIYEKGQVINKKNALAGLQRVIALRRDLLNDEFEGYDDLQELLRNVGVASANLESFLDISQGIESVGYRSLSKLLDNLEAIFRGAQELDGEHLIGAFRTQYESIANIVGQITEFNRAMTFRQNNKSYPSFAVPNYVTTLFKKFVSEGVNPETGESRRDEILSKYKRDKWFYRNGEWYNEWLRLIEEDPNLLEELREDGGCGLADVSMLEGIPYTEWTPEMIKTNFIKIYFQSQGSKYARYHLPILSDSPISMFIKFRRYGEDYQQQIVPLLRKVVLQELYRQNKVAERKKNGVPAISNYDKNGDKFFFFDEMNSYMSSIPYNIISAYYNRQGTETATKKLEALTPDSNGIVRVSFGDAVRAYISNNDTVSAYDIIDEAIIEIMDKQFAQFKGSYIEDRLSQFLIKDKIVARPAPENETEQARIKREEENQSTKYDTVDDALREFYWNDIFAQTQIIEITTVDPAFYKWDGGVDFQKRYKEVYAAGKKLDTSSKYGRTLQRSLTLSDQVITSRNYEAIKKLFDKAYKEGRITEMDRDSILNKFREVNVSDAQALRSISSMRAVLDMIGAWNQDMESSFNRIINNEWDMADFYTIWQTLKPFVFDVTTKSDGIGGEHLVPVQNKNSEFVVLAMYSMYAAATKESAKLRALSKFMEDNDIDVIQFESAVKAGLQSPININFSERKLNQLIENSTLKSIQVLKDAKDLSPVDRFNRVKEALDKALDKGEISQEQYNQSMDFIEPSEEEVLEALHNATYTVDGQYNDAVVTTIPYSSYSIQQPTPEHLLDTKVVFGSQFRNLIISDMPDDPNFRVEIAGKSYTKKEVLDLYDSLVVDNKIEDFMKAMSKVNNIESLQATLLSTIEGNPKYSRDMLNALSFIKHNGKDAFALPLDFPTMKNQVEELILAIFKNGVTKEKIKGASCILASDIGLTSKLNIKLKNGENWDGKDESRNLVEYAECYLPAWSREYFKDFMVKKVNKETGKEYMELDIDSVPAELKEMIGYRIPTEGKYSMIPLRVIGFLPQQNGSAIMLPADITTLAGSDFDVDKLFMMLPEFHKVDGKYVKDTYDYSKETPEGQSRAAKNNAILDIALGILRNSQMAEHLFNPGSFDEIKLQVRRNQIIADNYLFSRYMESIGTKDSNKAMESLRRDTLESMDSFLKQFQRKRSLLSLDTFIYNHNQNMTGGALIGVYANNTTMQAKYQTTALAVKEEHSFTVNGKKIQSLHSIYTQDGHLISKNCAYFSAASVDNVKDPVLARIRQNMNTAFITGFMLRAGMSVEEICLLFSMPDVAYLIDATRDIKNLDKFLESKFKKYSETYGLSIDLTKATANAKKHNFTTKELQDLLRFNSEFYAMQPSEKEEVPRERVQKHFETLAMAEALFSHIAKLAAALRDSVQISRADSPNGAIGNSRSSAPNFVVANRQVSKVEQYVIKSRDPQFPLEGISDILKNNIFGDKPITRVSRKEMFKAFMSEEVPMRRLQVFYSLGIDYPLQLVSKYFLSQSRTIQNIKQTLEDYSQRGDLSDEQERNLYKAAIIYALSKTKLFGDDGEHTFEEKRNYYLYQYPQVFKKVLEENKDIAKLPALGSMRVKNGRIVMERSGRSTPILRNEIQRNFDSLLLDTENEVSQKLAFDLMMYSFYRDGLFFNPQSYGYYFSTVFLSSFPEMLDSLRVTRPDAFEFHDLINQFILQQSSIGIFQNYQDNDVEVIEKDENDLPLTFNVKKSNIKRNKNWRYTGIENKPNYQYVTLDDALYQLSAENEGFITYRYVPTIKDAFGMRFNGNMTSQELVSLGFDEDRYKNLLLLNSTKTKNRRGIEEESSAGNFRDLDREATEFGSEFSFPEFGEGYEEFIGQAETSPVYNLEDAQKVQTDNGGKPLC